MDPKITSNPAAVDHFYGLGIKKSGPLYHPGRFIFWLGDLLSSNGNLHFYNMMAVNSRR